MVGAGSAHEMPIIEAARDRPAQPAVTPESPAEETSALCQGSGPRSLLPQVRLTESQVEEMRPKSRESDDGVGWCV